MKQQWIDWDDRRKARGFWTNETPPMHHWFISSSGEIIEQVRFLSCSKLKFFQKWMGMFVY
jgi:hypothetical protein